MRYGSVATMVAWLDREEIAKMRERRMRKIVRNLPPRLRKFALALSVPSSISNPKGSKMKLNEAIRGMEVKGWERRESSNGKCVVYVRFAPKSSAPTVNVKEA